MSTLAVATTGTVLAARATASASYSIFASVTSSICVDNMPHRYARRQAGREILLPPRLGVETAILNLVKSVVLLGAKKATLAY